MQIGLSELSGALDHMNTIVHECVDKGILSENVQHKWDALANEHDLLWVLRILNAKQYPEEERSQTNVKKAVTKLLSFGSKI